jgi:hypothetical protein
LSVRGRIAVALDRLCVGCALDAVYTRRVGLIRTIPCALTARRMVTAQTRTPERRCNSSAISSRLACARSVTISRRITIFPCFKVGALPPAWTGSVKPSSGCFVAIACSFHTTKACQSYVIDSVYTLLHSWEPHLQLWARHPDNPRQIGTQLRLILNAINNSPASSNFSTSQPV